MLFLLGHSVHARAVDVHRNWQRDDQEEDGPGNGHFHCDLTLGVGDFSAHRSNAHDLDEDVGHEANADDADHTPREAASKQSPDTAAVLLNFLAAGNLRPVTRIFNVHSLETTHGKVPFGRNLWSRITEAPCFSV